MNYNTRSTSSAAGENSTAKLAKTQPPTIEEDSPPEKQVVNADNIAEFDERKAEYLPTQKHDLVKDAGGFYHHRTGCYTGYIDLEDIHQAIPELDLLKEWKVMAFEDAKDELSMGKPGSTAQMKLIRETIKGYRVWQRKHFASCAARQKLPVLNGFLATPWTEQCQTMLLKIRRNSTSLTKC